jgi:hypothetical protein
LQEIRQWDQRVTILLNLIKQLSLGLLEALPTQFQPVVHRLIICPLSTAANSSTTS